LPSKDTFTDADPLLTIHEVARELRCSKTHVQNIIGGKFPDLPPLPILRLGRRVLIRHDGLRAWMLLIEARETELQKLSGLFH
jgi:hypothetical protein